MPEEYDFSNALENIKILIVDVGGDVAREIDGSIIELGDEIGESGGVWGERGGNRFVVFGGSSIRYFTILVPVSLLPNIVEAMDEETIAEYSDEGTDGQEARQTAAMNWLDSVEEETMEEIKFHLRERLTSPDVGFDIKTSENGSLIGFSIESKIFPYEDEFSIQEFEKSVQAVISTSVLGQNFIGETFHIEASVISEPTIPDTER